MGMALPEASSNPPPRQEPVENARARGLRGGFANGGARGLSAEMAKQAENDTSTPVKGRFRAALLSGFASRDGRGNATPTRPSVDRDGFSRGFSVGSRRMATTNSDGTTRDTDQAPYQESEERGSQGAGEMVMTPDIESSRSMAIYFDSEQMDRGLVIDDSPIYGSVRTSLTPELGSFHTRDDGGGEDSDASDAAVESRPAGAQSFREDDPPNGRRIFTHRKNPSAEKLASTKSQLHPDFVLGAERANGSSKRSEGYISSRLYAKPLAAARDEYIISNQSSPSPDVQAQGNNNSFGGVSVGSYEITFDDVGDAPLGWSNMFPRGEQPEPRQFHAAAVVGRRMVVVGGQTASGPCNDVQMLHLSRMTWSELGRGRGFPNGKPGNNLKAAPGQLPLYRGHSLISWGKTVLLVGGEMSPSSDRVEVWSFDLETESWTKVTAKGEVPAARSGQSVTRAGSILIMFGGETLKGQKLNDLHILDLKSLMWLPLHTLGSGPSARAKHCATMYDDRYLLVFGGASKSKPLNDLFALDFETMEWSRMKTKGITPSPRCGHAGILIGDKWYIAGGETRGHGSIETLMLDVGNLTWSRIAATTPNTAVANQGLSLVLVQRKEKTMLVAFGGKGSQLSNQVHSLYIMPLDHVKTSSYNGNSDVVRDGQANATTPTMAGSGLPCACVDVAKTHLAPLAEELYGSRTSPGSSPWTENSFDTNGPISLRRRYGPEKSKFPVVRQPPAEILSRVLRETSAQECTSPLHHLQHYKVPDAVPVLDLELRDNLTPIATWSSESLRRPGGSSMRKVSFGDSTLTSVMESGEYIDDSRRVAMIADLGMQTKSHGSERTENLYTTTQRHSWEGEECSDSQLLADLQDAMTMERRIHLINKYRQSFEMKLAAAVHMGELADARLASALRGKEEAKKSLCLAMKTRQHAEGKLAASLVAQTDLKERAAAAERAQDDSNNLCNVVHSENLRLEHDMAFLKAVLEDTQKELQSSREALSNERARSFQLQMEVFDLKKKLFTGETVPNLTSETLLLPVSENV